MAKKRSDEDKRKILAEARQRFRRCQQWESNTRDRQENDIKFAEGDSDNLYQWPEDIRGRMEAETKPMLTVNKTKQHCLDILNDARQSRVAIKIRATGDGSTVESAEVYNGVVRHIEYISNAGTAYQTGLNFAVRGGIGYWRVLTGYANDDSFDQEIFIRRIKDPFSVYLDPDINEFDGSDARYGFVGSELPREEWEAEMKGRDAPPGSSDNALVPGESWVREDTVRIAEYFRRVQQTDTLVAYLTDPNDPESMQIQRKSEMNPKLAELLMAQSTTKTRPIKTHKVEWFKIMGNEIVDEKDWPGVYIPIVRCVGEETVIDGELDRKGHVRALKDPQRMFNYNAPLSLSTPLPTPSGWTTMGEVQPGDWLLDENGEPAQVDGISPTHINRKCYRVQFDDGSHIIADGAHLWTVEERGKRIAAGQNWSMQTISTEELTPKKHFIYSTRPLDLPEAELPIHPYVLGAWLGDGSSRSATIHSGFSDMDEMRANLAACGYRIGEPRIYASSGAAEITVHGLQSQVREAGLLGNKHIPAIYLRASQEQREMLLQGLMDTDGNISKGKQYSFTSTFPALADGFAELLRTLGIKPVSRIILGAAAQFPNGETYTRKDAERFSFAADSARPLFRLNRKIALQSTPRPETPRRTKRHCIVSVTPVPSVPVKCLAINSESHLFLAGPGMVPTHNSGSIEFGALQSKTPYLTPADAIEGYEQFWETANTENHAFLPFNHMDDEGEPIPAPQRQQPPASAPVFMQGMMDAAEWMRMVSGQYQADMGAPGNERSGVAIEQRQRQGDNATYHFLDHQSIAIRYTGKILIDLIPKVYDTARILKIRAEDGAETEVKIDPNAQQAVQKQEDKAKDQVQMIFNPSVGKYDVEADVGPAFATKRQEAFNAYTQLLAQNKDLTNIIGDLMLMAADFPGAEEAAERLKRMVPKQALEDGPSPDMQAAQQQIQALEGFVTKLAQKLADKTAEHRNEGEKNAVSAYDSQTKRLAALKEALGLAPEDLLSLVRQVIMEAESTSSVGLAPALTPDPLITAQDVMPQPPQQAPGQMTNGAAAPEMMPGNADPSDMGSGPAGPGGNGPI